ncbi:hypothetical protein [Desulfoplanes sp.]
MEQVLGLLFACLCIFYIVKTRKKGKKSRTGSGHYYDERYHDTDRAEDNGPQESGSDGGGDDD